MSELRTRHRCRSVSIASGVIALITTILAFRIMHHLPDEDTLIGALIVIALMSSILSVIQWIRTLPHRGALYGWDRR